MPSQAAILDAHYMARALELARKGLYTTHPNPRVGCVIVRDGEVVGEGWHVRAMSPMPKCMPCVRPVNLPEVLVPMSPWNHAATMAVRRRVPKRWSRPVWRV